MLYSGSVGLLLGLLGIYGPGRGVEGYISSLLRPLVIRGISFASAGGVVGSPSSTSFRVGGVGVKSETALRVGFTWNRLYLG